MKKEWLFAAMLVWGLEGCGNGDETSLMDAGAEGGAGGRGGVTGQGIGGRGSGGATREGTGGSLGMGGATSSSGGSAGAIVDAGTRGSGGATATGGVTGAGRSATTTADCGVTPVTPNATAATKKVLCYLHSVYGNHILSAQEENNDDIGMNTIFQATGKYPAIRAFDVNNSRAPSQCVQHWNNGGICMFGYHMGINGASFSVATNITNVLTAGTSENRSFNQDLDQIAQFVQPLQAAGGVAILRLFHEAGKACNWFWWTMGTSAQWQSIFKYAFNYQATKGLNNVLWLAPLCGSPDPEVSSPQSRSTESAQSPQRLGNTLCDDTRSGPGTPWLPFCMNLRSPVPWDVGHERSSAKYLFECASHHHLLPGVHAHRHAEYGRRGRRLRRVELNWRARRGS